MPTKLSLTVQYGVTAPELPRARLRRWAQKAANHVAPQASPRWDAMALTLRLVDASEAQQLNREFRQRDYATNVLTFEYGIDPSGTVSGDIVLCLPVLQREAREQNKALTDHAAHLIVHGVLHTAGYDHTEARDAQKMEAIETAILSEMGINDPYRN